MAIGSGKFSLSGYQPCPKANGNLNPSQTAMPDAAAKGQFAPGKLGRGNPHAQRIAEYREAIRGAVSASDSNASLPD